MQDACNVQVAQPHHAPCAITLSCCGDLLTCNKSWQIKGLYQIQRMVDTVHGMATWLEVPESHLHQHCTDTDLLFQTKLWITRFRGVQVQAEH